MDQPKETDAIPTADQVKSVVFFYRFLLVSDCLLRLKRYAISMRPTVIQFNVFKKTIRKIFADERTLPQC